MSKHIFFPRTRYEYLRINGRKKNCVFHTNHVANHGAVLEGIAAVTGNTRASGSMINDLAFSELSASTGARILTLRLHASESGYAVCIDNAFWSTSLVRIADVIG